MAKVVSEKEMTVSRDTLYEVICDFDSYPEFVSEVVSVKIHPGRTEEGCRVTFELELVKRFQYTLEFKLKKGEEVSWKLVESNFFKTNAGGWILKNSGKSKTHATYELDVSFGFLVPGWITKKLTENNLPKMLDNFEARAKKVGAKK